MVLIEETNPPKKTSAVSLWGSISSTFHFPSSFVREIVAVSVYVLLIDFIFESKIEVAKESILSWDAPDRARVNAWLR